MTKIIEQKTTPSRRAFLAGSAGLVIAMTLPLKRNALAQDNNSEPFAPNAFVRVAPDNTVTILSKNIEFGQGPWTGHATLVADEMDADWDQIRVEHAPSNPQLYGNPGLGAQGTGGSSSMAAAHEQMRKAGATAKAMLVAAAAQTWDVDAADIKVEKGIVSSGTNSATFGELANLAATLTPPEDVKLKTPDQFIYIGKSDLPKIDTKMKSTGEAIYTLDLYKDDMLTAVIEHADVPGATVSGFDDSQSRQVSGVVDVKQLPSGVAIFADNTFAALKGRKTLKVDWDNSTGETRTSDAIMKACQDAAKTDGMSYHEHGDVEAAFEAADTVLEAEYTFPYLVHAPMEPLDAVIARGEDGSIDAWMGSQIQTSDHGAIAQVCGVPQDKVRLHTMLAGGSFGRRAQYDASFAVEAASAFMAAGGERPVKVMWTREDDIRGAYYRPITVHRMKGALDADGNIIALDQVIAGQSFIKGSPWENFMIQQGVDVTMVEGAREIPYGLPNRRGSIHIVESAVKTLWWRSVGHTHTGHALECFIDDLLAAGGQDSVEGRLKLMGENQRLAKTLERAAEMADWGRTRSNGRALGVATVESFSSYVSQVAEVSMENGLPKVHKVWCAVDCGLAINPEVVKAQMEGGIGYGLGAVLYNELTLGQGGKIKQSNFHDYASLRIGDMPEIDVSIIASDAPPTGVGEPGTPPIGPAVANALRNLNWQPIRNLPIVPVGTA